jgi:hypothetical protein
MNELRVYSFGGSGVSPSDGSSGFVVNADLRVIGQKVVNEFGFMSREIIGDEVDLASEGLGGHYVGKKVDELDAGMALSGLAKDFAASGTKGREKGFHGGNTQNHGLRLCLEKGAEQDPGGPRLG